MAVFEVKSLADEPIAAAAQFYAKYLPLIEMALATGDGSLILVFPPADHTHRGWRLAAVQSLARAHAPSRINAISGADGAVILAARDYLSHAEGVTGQYLLLDGNGAAPVLS
jgi:hypothetical protein